MEWIASERLCCIYRIVKCTAVADKQWDCSVKLKV
jgi:hypothetical protein